MTGTFRARDRVLPLGGRTYVMGILNLTPDSFSDGGRFPGAEAALEHAREMVRWGADILDVGGESTRPGAPPVSADEELGRIHEILERLPKEVDVPLSIDTSKAQVAREALAHGFHIVNDVWGFQKDPDLAAEAARFRAGCVLMHNREDEDRGDIVLEVETFLKTSAQIAKEAGIDPEGIWVDPGIGFGKVPRESYEVLRHLSRLKGIGSGILVGPSRKRFLGAVTGRSVADRMVATAAAVTASVLLGADCVRVHDVKEMVDACRVADAICRP